MRRAIYMVRRRRRSQFYMVRQKTALITVAALGSPCDTGSESVHRGGSMGAVCVCVRKQHTRASSSRVAII